MAGLTLLEMQNQLPSHPRKAHVPPKGSESIMATFHPAERHSCAAVEAAVPVPITIKSNVLFIYRNQQDSVWINSKSYDGY